MVNMDDNVRHSSDTNEHYTPADIVEAARTTLGAFDLDPASCGAANQHVQAAKFYTKEDNGYMKFWEGRVFLNPPGGLCDIFGQEVLKKSKTTGPCTETGACGLPVGHTHTGTTSSQKLWWQTLVQHWVAGNVTDAIFVCFSIELLQTTQVKPVGPLPLMFPICFPSRRVSYIRGSDGLAGGSPPHSSAIICVSDDPYVISRFRETFATMGHVIVPLYGAHRTEPELLSEAAGDEERSKASVENDSLKGEAS